jgi:hypothetical protein
VIHESEGRLRPRSKAIKAREGVEIFAAAHKANGFKTQNQSGMKRSAAITAASSPEPTRRSIMRHRMQLFRIRFD